MMRAGQRPRSPYLKAAVGTVLLLALPFVGSTLVSNVAAVLINRAMLFPTPADGPTLWDARTAPVCRVARECERMQHILSTMTNLGVTDQRLSTQLGLVALMRRDLQPAEQSLELAVGDGPGGRDARFLLGYVYHFDGRTEEANAIWSEAVAGQFFADGKGATRPLERSSADKSLANAQLALEVDPQQRVPMYQRIGDIQTELGRKASSERRTGDAAGYYSSAIGAYGRALELAPDAADIHLSLGRVYRLLDRRAEAEAEFRLAAMSNATRLQVDAYRELGQVLRDQKQLPEAVTALRSAIAIRPQDADLRLTLGDWLRQSGDTEAAETAWREATQVPDPRQQARAYEALGNLYQGQKRYTEAEAAVREAIARVAGITQYQVQLASVLYQQKRSDEAEATLIQVIERGDARLRDAASITLAQWQIEQQRPDRAISIYREAVQASPANGDLRLRLAGLLQRLGQLADAETEMQQATSNPERRWQVEAYRALGGLYEQQKRWPDALAAYDAGLALQPGDADLQQRRKRTDDTARRPAG